MKTEKMEESVTMSVARTEYFQYGSHCSCRRNKTRRKNSDV